MPMAPATDALDSPVNFLSAMLGANLPDEPALRAYEAGCRRVPAAEMEAGAPDAEDIHRGYAAGVVWRGYVQETALPVFLLLYIAAFHDSRLIDIFTPTLTVTQMIDKYAPEPIRAEWLTRLKARDGSTPQGAALTPAPSPRRRGEKAIVAATSAISVTSNLWHLSGRIATPRNFDATIAVIAASVEGADAPALFLVPSLRANGSANFRANADEAVFASSEAWLLGEISDGPALIGEIDGLTLAARRIGEAARLQRQLHRHVEIPVPLKAAFALAWHAVELLNWTWRELPILISPTARLFQAVVGLNNDSARPEQAARLIARLDAARAIAGDSISS